MFIKDMTLTSLIDSSVVRAFVVTFNVPLSTNDSISDKQNELMTLAFELESIKLCLDTIVSK